jgi:excisionase family DNA binding protein
MTKSKHEGPAPTDKAGQVTECKTVTIEEAAKILGIGRSLAYGLAQLGELPGCRKLGGRYIVSRAGLLAFLGEVAA